ncbi:hypothetical protein M413DRAFT_326344 [Hebeloma cylindrosporum]|uniref:Uncharacterized protein n=1 Tax=Hebeloma cylindrosporum TaxID=76867 RepID=A0A0C3BWN1_HEBCY|nr:hypothetical protein M413DRAFT_326344 [Hebeloma cylindrosporum h7]
MFDGATHHASTSTITYSDPRRFNLRINIVELSRHRYTLITSPATSPSPWGFELWDMKHGRFATSMFDDVFDPPPRYIRPC